MTPRSFAYWLQGYFEIQDDNTPLNAEKSKAILKKIEAVDMSERNVDPRIARSIGYIEGQLETAVKIGYEDVFDEITKNIKTRLNRVFRHAIDPTIEGDQKDLKRRHKPGDSSGLEVLC